MAAEVEIEVPPLPAHESGSIYKLTPCTISFTIVS